MFNPDCLLLSLLWSSVGTGLCVYGKKQAAAVPLAGGLALIAVSCLVGSALLMSGISLALLAGMAWLIRTGH